MTEIQTQTRILKEIILGLLLDYEKETGCKITTNIAIYRSWITDNPSDTLREVDFSISPR